MLPGAGEVETLLGPALTDRKLLSGFETLVFTGVTPLGLRGKGEGPYTRGGHMYPRRGTFTPLHHTFPTTLTKEVFGYLPKQDEKQLYVLMYLIDRSCQYLVGMSHNDSWPKCPNPQRPPPPSKTPTLWQGRTLSQPQPRAL